MSRSTTRHGPSGRRSARKLRMRSVTGVSITRTRCDERLRGRARWRRPILWLKTVRGVRLQRLIGLRPTTPQEPLGLRRDAYGKGGSRSPRLARSSASSVTPAFGQPTETKKARYVVALSCVLQRGAATGTCDLGERDLSGLVPGFKRKIGSYTAADGV